MMERQALSERLVDQLLATLQAMPNVTSGLAEGGPPDAKPKVDAVVMLSLPNTAYTVLVEMKRTVYPRDARDAIWKCEMLRETRKPLPNTVTAMPMVVAESISDEAKALLRSERVAYFDSGGSLFFDAPGAYLYVDKATPKAIRKTVGALFAGKRAQVMHALLTHHHEWLGVTALAKLAHVSPATTSEVLRETERFDWLQVRGQGPSKERMLMEPRALLDTWAKQEKSTAVATQRYYVPRLKGNELVAQLDRCMTDAQTEYVLTAEAAAQRYAPYLSQLSLVRCRAGATRADRQALESLGARPVEEGANLEVAPLQVPGDLLFRERIDEAWLASPVLVYLDLLRNEGRAKELAEHLRQTKLGY
ncbi:type IV toxin-antitoxin system AbiEi family antitoxin [Ralstonia solanacearum]|uniref:Uncharacterized protein n=1 Tax=Ralstonia solanacearum TaxID=305 RepID=A0AAE3NGL2_RALSL|nr:type IV toxin-antitoxin system AbiEi family antitoxin [Ralstonia solanacearum]MBB6584465.1 hypothetical protein [Ralstonia solanacearum]MDB0521570.1 hypothetical protein [Ralstonia solanacearum]